jgi:hypothetical protein
VSEQDEAINKVLWKLINQYEQWRTNKAGLRNDQFNTGFSEAMRLAGAIARAELIEEAEEE